MQTQEQSMIYKTPADEETILKEMANRAKCSAWARHQLQQYLELRYMPSYTPGNAPPAANIAEATALMVHALREGINELRALDEYSAGQDA
jgi:hypothetical protein